MFLAAIQDQKSKTFFMAKTMNRSKIKEGLEFLAYQEQI